MCMLLELPFLFCSTLLHRRLQLLVGGLDQVALSSPLDHRRIQLLVGGLGRVALSSLLDQPLYEATLFSHLCL